MKMLDKVSETEEIKTIMAEIGRRAKKASQQLATASGAQKDEALNAMADKLLENSEDILAANEKDMIAAREGNMAPAFQDRLQLNDERIKAMAQSLRDIAELKDPVGQVMDKWERPNGLKMIAFVRRQQR